MPTVTPQPNLTDAGRLEMVQESKVQALNILTRALPNYDGRTERLVQKVQRRLQYYPFIPYHLSSNTQQGCDGELAFADIRALQVDVKLCPMFFTYSSLDRAQILIHEAIHLADDDMSECETTELEFNIMQQAGHVPFENGYVRRDCAADYPNVIRVN